MFHVKHNKYKHHIISYIKFQKINLKNKHMHFKQFNKKNKTIDKLIALF